METTESRQGAVCIVALHGHLDTVSSQPLEDRLVQLVQGGERQLVLDCSRLDYVNSSGLKAVLVAAKQLEAQQGRLILCGLSGPVHMIFEMIGFTRILHLEPGLEEAVAAMETARPQG